MDNSLHYTSVNHADHLIGSINQLRHKMELCDVILHVGTFQIPAHRLILSACTPYFHTLLENGTSLKKSCTELHLSEVDPVAVKSIVEFFYTSAISVTDESVWALLPTVCILQVEEIQTLCCDFLQSQLSTENSLSTFSLAASCECNTLKQEAAHFVKSNFDLIIKEEHYLELTLADLLSHVDKLCKEDIWDEDQIVCAIKSWVTRCEDERQQCGGRIVKQFPQLKEKLLEFIPEDLLTVEDNSQPLEGDTSKSDNSQHTGDFSVKMESDNFGRMSERLDNMSNSRDTDTSLLMCIVCGEVFDDQTEMDEHAVSHETFSTSTPLGKHLRPFSPFESESPFSKYKSTYQTGSSELEKHLRAISPHANHSPLSDHVSGLDLALQGDSSQPMQKKLTITVTSVSSDGSCLSYICPVCGKAFAEKKNLRVHLRAHSNENGFACTICSKTYSTKSNLQSHVRSHTGEKPFHCDFCDKSFSSYCVLKVHLRTHTGEKPFPCPTCGVAFAKNIHLKRHLSIHTGEKPHECNICGKKFSRSDHLKRHIQSIHTQNRPHICALCGKDFVRKYELNKHLKQQHWGMAFDLSEDGTFNGMQTEVGADMALSDANKKMESPQSDSPGSSRSLGQNFVEST